MTEPNYDTALVSIIIPAFNASSYIHRAIDSSLKQTHENVEVLVIDDGSKDDTLEVSREYSRKDSRVRVFTQANSGVSAARNHGMREAHGEYYMFLDADDWLEDYAVEFLLDAQREHPDMLIAADTYDVTPEGIKKFPDEDVQTRIVTIEDIAKSYCYIERKAVGFHSSCYKIYSADICKQNGLSFPEGIAYSEDAVFVINYFYCVKGACYINKPIMDVLQRTTSASRSLSTPEIVHRNLQSQIAAYDIMINHPKNTPEVSKLMKISRCVYIMFYVKPAINGEADRSALRDARRAVREYVNEYLTCDKFSYRKKLSFLYKIYLPVPIVRVLMRIEGKIQELRFGGKGK